MSVLTIFADGLCEPNPGLGTWAFVVLCEGEEIAHHAGWQRHATNNVMEHRAVLEALRWLRDHERVGAIVQTDSQLVAQQAMGYWACRQPHLWDMVAEERALIARTQAYVRWIRREYNARADALTRTAYTYACGQRAAEGMVPSTTPP